MKEGINIITPIAMAKSNRSMQTAQCYPNL